MMMSRNAYEIEKTRRQYLNEDNQREHLADIARAGDAKPARIISVVSAFHNVLPQRIRSTQQPSPVGKVIPHAVNG